MERVFMLWITIDWSNGIQTFLIGSMVHEINELMNSWVYWFMASLPWLNSSLMACHMPCILPHDLSLILPRLFSPAPFTRSIHMLHILNLMRRPIL